MVSSGPANQATVSASLSDCLRVEETRLLAEGMRSGSVTAILAVFFLGLIARDVSDPLKLSVWLLIAGAFHLAVAGLLHRSRLAGLPDGSGPRRLSLLVGIAGFAGLVWGAGGWFLLPTDDPAHTAQFVTLIAGIWAGAGAIFGVSPRALAWFLIPSALPTALRLGLSGTHNNSAWIGLSLIALVGVLVLSAARTRRGIVESIRLRVEGETRERLLQEQRTRLVESEEKYRLLFERSEDPMWLIVGDRFMLANDAAARFLEYDDAQAITNLHPSQLSPPYQPCGTASDEKAGQMMATAHRQGYHRFEWMHVTRLGSEIPVEVTLTRVPYEGAWALYCVWRDMSDRHRAAHDLQAARELAEQASVAKTTFLTTMSHEIRTPLSAVLGMTELLEDTSLDAHQREFTRSITAAGQNLLAVINDVLDLSKIEAGRLELSPRATDLSILLADLERMFRLRARKCGLGFVIDLQDDCPRHVVVDDSRLMQILINLCGNACKFTKEGEITVTASGSRDGKGEWRLVLEVSDTGIGIEEAVQKTLFSPFQQATNDISRRYGGTGLGLSISSRLAELMGGSIRLQSTPGKGSTFTVELPLELGEEPGIDAPSETKATPGECPPQPRTILVVDDVSINRRVASAMLTSLGLSHTVACNGEEAVQTFQEREIDLILMDCQMPVMDGYAATRRIREIEHGTDRHVPIIALTAAAMAHDRDRCEAAGMDDFLAKPFRRADLAAAVGRWLRRTDSVSPPAVGGDGDRKNGSEGRRRA